MLGATLAPASGEPPHGYASRLARCYGLRAADFCLDMGLTLQQLVDGRAAAIAGLAGLVGRESAEVGSHAMLREGTGCILRGQRVTRAALRRRQLQVCPRCLIEDVAASELAPDRAAYVRAIWLVESIRTCVRHGLALVPADGMAHGNGSATHDLAARVATCIPGLDGMAGNATRRAASSMERYLVRRIDGSDRESVPWLDTLAFHAAAKACEVVGAVRLHGRSPNLKELSGAQWWEAGAAGYDILRGGAPSLRAFLGDLQGTYDYKAGAGPQAVFGRLYQWLAFGAQDTDFDPVRAVVAEHVIETVPLPAGEIVLGHAVERRTLHSIHSAALETGLHPKRLRKLLVAAGYVAPEEAHPHLGRTDHRVVFGADACAEFLAVATGQLSLKEAGTYVNAPRVQIKLIAENAFITPLVRSRPGWQRAFSRAELDGFLSRLTRDAQVVAEVGEGKADVPTAAKAANCGAAEIIRLIVDRRLTWVGRLANEPGYMSVLVDVAEARRLTKGGDLGGVPWTDLNRMLRIGERTAKALVDTGILPTSVVRHPVNRCPVTIVRHGDIAKFDRDYVALFALAADTGTHFRVLQKTLQESGVTPCFPREIVKCGLYRRVDVSNALAGRRG